MEGQTEEESKEKERIEERGQSKLVRKKRQARAMQSGEKEKKSKQNWVKKTRRDERRWTHDGERGEEREGGVAQILFLRRSQLIARWESDQGGRGGQGGMLSLAGGSGGLLLRRLELAADVSLWRAACMLNESK